LSSTTIKTMFIFRKLGSTSNVLRATLRNSSTGAGLAGLSSASSGLIISTITDNEATATTYTVAGSTIESIATLGTYAAPTATKIRFKEVDATNHPGLYEIQLADARFAVSAARTIRIAFSGAASLLFKDFVIQLTTVDPDSAAFGLALAKTTNLTGLNDLSAAQVNTEADTALADVGVTSTVTGRIDAAISTRSSHSAADVWASTTRTLSSYGTLVADVAAAVWAAATRTLTAFSDSSGITTLLTRITSTRALLLDNLSGIDAPISSLPSSISDSVWDAVAADHNTAGSTGAKLNAAGASGDPLTQTPADYADGTIGQLIGKLDVGDPAEPVIPVLAPPAAGQLTGYLFTYDGQGNLKPSTPITFQLLNIPDAAAGSHQTATFVLTSAAAAAATPAFLSGSFKEGATYRAKRDDAAPGRRESVHAPWVEFIVPLLSSLEDPDSPSFSLPQILGTA
jgi:hypothetical protein